MTGQAGQGRARQGKAGFSRGVSTQQCEPGTGEGVERPPAPSPRTPGKAPTPSGAEGLAAGEDLSVLFEKRSPHAMSPGGPLLGPCVEKANPAGGWGAWPGSLQYVPALGRARRWAPWPLLGVSGVSLLPSNPLCFTLLSQP